MPQCMHPVVAACLDTHGPKRRTPDAIVEAVPVQRQAGRAGEEERCRGRRAVEGLPRQGDLRSRVTLQASGEREGHRLGQRHLTLSASFRRSEDRPVTLEQLHLPHDVHHPASSAARCVSRGRRAVSGRHGRAESGAAVPVNAQPPVECASKVVRSNRLRGTTRRDSNISAKRFDRNACGRTGFTLKSALTCTPGGEQVVLLIPTRSLLSRELEMLTNVLGSVGNFLELVIGALF